VLAVTGAERVAGLDAPTLKESGVDLEFTNWRGLVAPPGLTDADRESLAGLVAKMNDSPRWKDALAKNKFVDAYLAGAEFAAFLKAENERVGQVLHELGLA